MTSLLDDTLCRRLRRVVVDALHTADDTLGRIGRDRVRVLFEAASPLSLTIIRPILERLLSDPRLEFWFMTADLSWDANHIFRAAGIAQRVVTAREVRWMKFDAYINTDFWNMTWFPRHTRRVHFFHGVAGKYGLDAPVDIAPVVASFDRLMFPNRDRLRRYAEAGLIDQDGPQAALIGYPKTDCLVDGTLDRSAIERALGLDPTRPTVVYAPTWSPYSSLHGMGSAVILALRRLDFNVIVKLHDRSYDPVARSSGGINWRARLEALCLKCGAHLAQDADASPYLVVADVLVTDHSSVGFEFMLLDRPIVILDCPQLITMARVSGDKVRLLRRAAEVVRSADAAAAAVARAVSAPAALSAERRATAADLFYEPGGATARAVQSVYDLLSLPAPDGRQHTEARSARAPAAITPTVAG